MKPVILCAWSGVPTYDDIQRLTEGEVYPKLTREEIVEQIKKTRYVYDDELAFENYLLRKWSEK
ncbi:MAG: hypothetical protein IJH63_10140 [Methanobrevibacter sp.]|nr:hypothetical protein [Methanosphaera sp.]MBR0371058.1 hypothetical protein [Methanobrevibacter sp.]